jgi:DNA-binding CsgD family transcriptional regulator
VDGSKQLLEAEREQRSRGAPRRIDDARFFAIAAAATAALDQLDQGVALIDRVCRVSFANQQAQAICGETDGLALEGDRLVATSSPAAASLNSALKGAISEGKTSSLRLERSPGRRPLSLQITPLRSGFEGPDGDGAMVLISDSHQRAIPPKERLMTLYRLTPAEAGVAQLLLRGRDLATVAVDLDISVETVRTHVRRILGKTGARRQSDLMLLLLREVGGLR